MAVIVSLLIALANRNTKKLFYDVACEAEAGDFKRGRKNERRGRIATGETAIKLFVIDLHNPSWGIFSWLGGSDISPSDYDQRISIEFGENARILEADVVEEHPPGIGAKITPYHYPPDTLLLNQGDSLRLRMVVENPEQERSRFVRIYKVAMNGHVRGIREIARVWNVNKRSFYGLLVSVSAVGVSVFRDLISFVILLVIGENVTLFTLPVNTEELGTLPVYVFTFLTGVELAILLAGACMMYKASWKSRKQNKILEQYRKLSSAEFSDV
jgi:hypothetical protein